MRKYNVKYITDSTGTKKEVIIPIRQYQSLLEDLEDLAAAAECKKEKTISHEEVIQQLKKDGLIIK